ncbi:uncharacterized protein A4U43_C07F1320 [Asparagus officinalis]|uniref:Uncharacterized protein n=1 Tax=Asparagus officinalis TaxID=4686 RepID=A0A5P1EBT7_ASPOF|nr:uncharacterized protein A4U43_C07F1320 [Asparagus officinalis]
MPRNSCIRSPTRGRHPASSIKLDLDDNSEKPNLQKPFYLRDQKYGIIFTWRAAMPSNNPEEMMLIRSFQENATRRTDTASSMSSPPPDTDVIPYRGGLLLNAPPIRSPSPKIELDSFPSFSRSDPDPGPVFFLLARQRTPWNSLRPTNLNEPISILRRLAERGLDSHASLDSKQISAMNQTRRERERERRGKNIGIFLWERWKLLQGFYKEGGEVYYLSGQLPVTVTGRGPRHVQPVPDAELFPATADLGRSSRFLLSECQHVDALGGTWRVMEGPAPSESTLTSY